MNNHIETKNSETTDVIDQGVQNPERRAFLGRIINAGRGALAFAVASQLPACKDPNPVQMLPHDSNNLRTVTVEHLSQEQLDTLCSHRLIVKERRGKAVFEDSDGNIVPKGSVKKKKLMGSHRVLRYRRSDGDFAVDRPENGLEVGQKLDFARILRVPISFEDGEPKPGVIDFAGRTLRRGKGKKRYQMKLEQVNGKHYLVMFVRGRKFICPVAYEDLKQKDQRLAFIYNYEIPTTINADQPDEEPKDKPQEPKEKDEEKINSTNSVEIGVIRFEFSKEFSQKEIEYITQIYQKGYDYIAKNFISMEGVAKYSIKVEKNELSLKHTYNPHNQTLTLSQNYEDDLTHELIHVMLHDRSAYFDFVSEGLAEYLAEVLEENGIGSLGKMINVAISNNLLGSRDTEGAMLKLDDYNYYQPLSRFRYREAARGWKELCKVDPNIIKKFFDRFFAVLPRISEEDRPATAIEILRGILTETNKKQIEDEMLKGPKKMPSGKMLYAVYHEEPNEPNNGYLQIMLVNRDPDSMLETGISGEKVVCRINKVHDHSFGNEVSIDQTYRDGVLILPIKKIDANGSTIYPSGKYKAVIHCDRLGLKEEIIFEI